MSRAMQEPTLLVLASLADGPKHGYALIQEAEQLSGGRTVLRVGTLYTALDRLAREGLVARAGEEVVDGRLRRSYELTGLGREALEAEVERLRTLSTRVAARLRATGTATA
jgi:PadR family transcriptional regulator, regulatory protein PadR